MTDALPVGPILIGTAKPAHILTPSVTARGVVNMTALAVVEGAAPNAGTRADEPRTRASVIAFVTAGDDKPRTNG